MTRRRAGGCVTGPPWSSPSPSPESLVPHTGFEPVISALRGRCPGPLDECGPVAGDIAARPADRIADGHGATGEGAGLGGRRSAPRTGRSLASATWSRPCDFAWYRAPSAAAISALIG